MSLYNFSLGALFNRVANIAAHPGYFFIVLILSLSLYILLFVYSLYNTREKFTRVDTKFILEFSLFVMFILIVSPVVHEHHYIFLYIPILFLWVYLSSNTIFIPAILFISAFLLIGSRYSLEKFPPFSAGPLAVFTGFKTYGVIILFFLTSYIIEKMRKDKG
jgi:hypothetical protein